MSDKYFTMVKDGQQVVATLNQTGTIVPEEGKDPTKYYTALVQTEDGLQQVVKTYDMNGGGGGGGYVLPPATANTLGGVKVGANLTVEADGTLNATGGGGSGADTSLSNLTDAGQIKAAHLAMPSGVYDELTIPSVDGSDITVPADGYLCLRGVAQGESPVLGLSNNTTGMNITSNATFMSALDFGITLPVKKGDSVKVGFYHVNFNDATNHGFLRFIYANGSESENQGA